MGISLPPPPVVEFGELPPAKRIQLKRREKDAKKAKEGEGDKKSEEPKKRNSILGQTVKPDSRTVFVNDIAANSAFKYGVSSCKNYLEDMIR